MAYFGSIFFANMGGGGGQKLFSKGGFGKGGGGWESRGHQNRPFVFLAWFFNEGFCKSGCQPAWDCKNRLGAVPVNDATAGLKCFWRTIFSVIGQISSPLQHVRANGQNRFFRRFRRYVRRSPQNCSQKQIGKSPCSSFSPFRWKRHTQIAKIAVRASWGVDGKFCLRLMPFGCLRYSNTLHLAIDSLFRLGFMKVSHVEDPMLLQWSGWATARLASGLCEKWILVAPFS